MKLGVPSVNLANNNFRVFREEHHWEETLRAFGREQKLKMQSLSITSRIPICWYFYCWFSHDVTKIQTEKTSDPTDILLSRCIRAAEK